MTETSEKAEQAQPVDGRVARGLRTRAAVIDAVLDLVEEGDLRPTAPAVAERAGVSLRSVFQHFSDMDSLFIAAARRHAKRILPLYEEPLPTGPLRERVPAFVRRRARLWEAATPVRRAARLYVGQSPGLNDLLELSRAGHRHEVVGVFHDLDLSPEKVEALDLLLSWDTWDVLRGERNLSSDDASAVIEVAVSAILRDEESR